MPLARARIDLHVIADHPITWALGIAQGWWLPDGAPGPEAGALVRDGFARARLTNTPWPRLIANGLGGFQVRCPACDVGLARPLARAMAALRDERRLVDVVCPRCGSANPIGALDMRPPAAFTHIDLALLDAGDIDLTPAGRAAAEAAWGPVRAIVRRPS